MNKAIFLDRDGVLNIPIIKNGKPYAPLSLEEFKIVQSALSVCEVLKSLGYLLVVITNQPEISRGTLPLSIFYDMNTILKNQLPIDHIVVCPHSDSDKCFCRKPLPGMIYKSSYELEIDCSKSWVIGDRWKDIECGKIAGCKTIFIDYNYDEILSNFPDFTVKSLQDVVNIIT